MQNQTPQPTGTYIYLELVKPVGATLVIPDSAEDPGCDIIVRAIGPKVEQIKVGDNVLLRPGCNRLSNPEKPDFCFTDASSVIAVIGGEQTNLN